MTRSEIENYRASMKIVSDWLSAGIINEDDFKVAEAFLAKKYCIKSNELFKVNSSLLPDDRVINIVGQNDETGSEESNQIKNVTTIGKKI